MAFSPPYQPAETRYDKMPYRICGRSGLKLPAISLGLWQNFGGADVFETGRDILRYAFDNGVTHFDLANNYGPPYGSAEENFGKVRLKRMGLDYVDIFYSHRVDPETPLEETMGALTQIHRQGKALYVGISSYSPELTRKAAEILARENVPLLIHQPSYSMVNRWIEDELLDTLEELGTGCIGFSPLAQGLLTKKYLNGIPEDARAAKGGSFSEGLLTEDNIERIKGLTAIAERRGQSLAQMAIAWVLRDPRVTSALVGARTVEQIANTLASLDNLDFTNEELKEIDRFATEGGINIWKVSSDL